MARVFASVPLLLAALIAPAATACVCAGVPIQFENARGIGSRSDAVFEGTVIEKRVVVGEYDRLYFPINAYTFAVRRVWIGARKPTLELLQAFGDCGRDFSPGARYLVYADRSGARRNHLSTGSCSSTRRLDNARPSSYLDWLGVPAATFTEPSAKSLPGRIDRFGYFVRGYLIAGACVIANVLLQPQRSQRFYLDPGIIISAYTGLGAAALLCIGAALLRRRRNVRRVGYLLAVCTVALTLFVTGHLYSQRSSVWATVQWRAPDNAPPPPPPPPETTLPANGRSD